MNKRNQFGYSNILVWPFYGILCTITLLLWPLTGLGLSLILVGVPALLFAVWAERYDQTDWETIFTEVDNYKTWANKPRPVEATLPEKVIDTCSSAITKLKNIKLAKPTLKQSPKAAS